MQIGSFLEGALAIGSCVVGLGTTSIWLAQFWIAAHASAVDPPVESWPKRLLVIAAAVLGLLLFGWMAWVMGLLARDSLTVLANDIESPGWSTTSGRIISSNVVQWQESGDTYFEPSLEYSYVVAGRTYRGTTIRFGGFVPALPDDTSEAEASNRRYPTGARVRVYFDRSDPSVSVLEPGAGRFRIILLLALWVIMLVVFGLLAGACALVAFGRLRLRRNWKAPG